MAGRGLPAFAGGGNAVCGLHPTHDIVDNMRLEYWDPIRQRYLLYRQPEQHAADCKRYPFESIPHRIFLDTNVINRLVRWRDQIFEYEAIPPETEEQLAFDIEALMHVLHRADRTSMRLIGSIKTIEELGDTPDPAWRNALVSYGIELVDEHLGSENHSFAIDFGRRLVGSQLVAPLPDTADQELIAHAIALGCDTFCTCDRKTILSKRNRLDHLPIRIMTPVEWWANVKPWSGLWS